jgi:branched-subunit amino acid aminotransferase/4-amino-4-deoxychorismate lyase
MSEWSSAMFIDGLPATLEDLAHQALVNYGAYTSFRVENGAVRGLDLHLQRLDEAAVHLFGESPGQVEFRRLLALSAGGRDKAWMRVSLFSPEISHRNPSFVGRPRVMTVVSPAPPPLAARMRVTAVPHGRETPHLKHVATFGQTRVRRAARAAGFDDALFVDDKGYVSEGVTWNIGFLSGDTVIWPQAPMLAGVAQALVDGGLPAVGLSSERRPVRLADLHSFDGAFICNSATPVCPVSAIDSTVYAIDVERIDRLAAAYAAAAPQPIQAPG